MTRDTVPRPPPARAATASSVGRRSPFMFSPPWMICWLLFCRTAQASTPDGPGIPESALFGNSELGLIIDVDQAESLTVPPRPVEVVHQRPGEIALERGSRLDRGVA